MKRIIPLLYFLVSTFLLFIFISLLFTFVYADTSKDELKKIQKDIRVHKKRLESVKKVESSVLQELQMTNAELNRIEKQLAEQRNRVRKIKASIDSLEADIYRNRQGIDAQSALLKKRLRVLQKVGTANDVIFILVTKEDVSQIIRSLRYISDISKYDYNLINRYKEALTALSDKKKELSRQYENLKHEENKLARIDNTLKEKKKEKESLLVKVRREKGEYERMIRELQEASKRLSRIIQESEKRESGLKGKRDVAKIKPSDEDIADDSDFARQKGKLPWPVNGKIAVGYGTQVDPIFNLPVFRSGIHIKTSEDTSASAVYGGKVVFADDFKGYGKLVIISHGGGYHTLYGNLSSIFLRNGAIINKGEPVGTVGESNVVGDNALYFEVRYKGRPLDPQQWLR